MSMMRITRIDGLAELSPRAWNSLGGTDNPFMRYEFLAALEHHGCVGDEAGWIPRFLVAEEDDRLVGAVPLYLKYHSFGEFVFDWAWAHAYESTGRRYYPKLVVAAPFTPISGPRLLIAPTADHNRVAEALINATLDQARSSGASSLHWLFINDDDSRLLAQHGLMRRVGCQFHWLNQGYRDFDDFLRHLSADKRKKIKRERRRSGEDGLEFEVRHGEQLGQLHWETFHDFYRATFWKKGNFAPLNLDFFTELGRTMPENVLVIFARHRDRYVAGALFLRNQHTLYGRHWGCSAEFHSLHFETCYYRAIEYCIQHKLSGFEAGAQGEHKISRGFLPIATWSAHWIGDKKFNLAIKDFLSREQKAVSAYITEIREHSPYKSPPGHAEPGRDNGPDPLTVASTRAVP